MENIARMKKVSNFVSPKGSGLCVRKSVKQGILGFERGRPHTEPIQGLFLLPLLNGRNRRQRQGFERILLRDVTQYPSAAQRKEARYHGGRISRSIFPDLQTRCCVRTFETEPVQSSKVVERSRGQICPSHSQQNTEPVSKMTEDKYNRLLITKGKLVADRRKMKSESGKLNHYTAEVKEKQKTLDERKKSLKRNVTPSELIINGLLLTLKPKIGRAINQKGFIAGNGYCIVDFYVPKLGLCIEVDGGYHFTDSQQRKDWYKNKYLTNERNMSIFRIQNEECLDLDSESLLQMIRSCKPKTVTYSPRYYDTRKKYT